MTPYSISCSTCNARLKVRDERAIGELSLCPKCGSMVMITPPSPAGVAEPIAPSANVGDSSPRIIVGGGAIANEFDDAAALLSDTIDDNAPPKANPAAQSKTESPRQPATTKKQSTASPGATSGERAQEAAAPTPPASQAAKKKTQDIAAAAALAAVPPLDTTTPPPIETPLDSMSSFDLDPAVATATPSALAKAGGAVGQRQVSPAKASAESTSGAAAPPPVALAAWSTPAQLAWQRYGLIGAVALAAVVVLGGLVAFMFQGPREETVAEETPPAQVVPIPDPDGFEEGTADGSPENPGEESEAVPGDGAPDVDDNSSGSDTEPSDLDPPNPDDNIDIEGPDPIVPEVPGDAPPLFTEDSPPEKPLDEPTADTGLGELAPLIDAFHVPPVATRPVTPDGPSDFPAPVPTATTSLPRPDPVNINVKARLADKIAGIDTGGASLVNVLELITQLSTIPITLSPDALAQMKLRADTPVSIALGETTVEGILDNVLGKALAYEIHGDHLVIRSAASLGRERIVPHEVDDLANSPEETLVLANTIKALIVPGSWSGPAATGKIVVGDASLTVTNSFDDQFQIHVFLQKVRVARGLEPRSKFDKNLFAIASRTRRAEAKLNTRVRAVFHVEQPLVKVLGHLEKAAGVTFIVDWQALGEVGWPPYSTAAVVADDVPLSEALDELLGPMDLAYRVIDERTLQITSMTALTQVAELELYPVADLLAAKGITARELLDDLQTDLGPGLFAAADGPFELRFDAPSQCLLVRLPQAQQRALEKLIAAYGE